MDILSKLPSFKNVEEAIGVKDAIDEAGSKAERIKFHRNHVRNGPANFKGLTSGQERRARQRALNAMTRKARRKQIRDYFATTRKAAVVHGYLQGAGVISYAGGQAPTHEHAVRAVRWILERFGKVDVEGNLLTDQGSVQAALQDAFNFWQKATGQSETTIDWTVSA